MKRTIAIVAILVAGACSEKKKSPEQRAAKIALPKVEHKEPRPPDFVEACEDVWTLTQSIRDCTSTLPEAARTAANGAMEQLLSQIRDTQPEDQRQILCGQLWEPLRSGYTSVCPNMTALVHPARPVAPAIVDPPVSPIDAPPAGSREVAAEAGVPFDEAAVGNLAHPFGVLESLTHASKRDDILVALPNAKRVNDARLTVPLGVEKIVATIDLDAENGLDVVRIPVTPEQIALLDRAWGKRIDGTWWDAKRQWRADLERADELVIGPFVPFGEVIRDAPKLLGASLAELDNQFGKRFDRARALVQRPATEHCMYFAHFDLKIVDGHVTRVDVRECARSETQRRAVLASFEKTFGAATPVRVDERAFLEITISPGVRMLLTEQPGAWIGMISKR